MTSKVLTSVDIDPQGRLDLSRRAPPNSVAIEMIRRQKHSGQALSLAITSSGLDDQEVCDALHIDAGYLSRMKKGDATLKGDLLQAFCDMVGNTIYVEWLAYQVGCTLVVIKSEAERRAELAEERARKAEEKMRIFEDLLRSRSVA